MDAETMMKTWLPAGIQGFEQLQKMFWSQFQASGAGSSTDNGSKSKD
jgi:flagellar assembly factor FliW